MKRYVCLDKDNNVLGIIEKTSDEFWSEITGTYKTIPITKEEISKYNSREYTKYILKDNKVVGKKGYERKPSKSLRDEIQELKEEINKLKEISNASNSR